MTRLDFANADTTRGVRLSLCLAFLFSPLLFSVLRWKRQAEAVVLVSDEASDSEVLLVSFELEQMLADLPRGTRAPKVG